MQLVFDVCNTRLQIRSEHLHDLHDKLCEVRVTWWISKGLFNELPRLKVLAVCDSTGILHSRRQTRPNRCLFAFRHSHLQLKAQV